MKFVILCALIAVACADVSHLSQQYLPPQAVPQAAPSAPINQYVPPAPPAAPAAPVVLAAPEVPAPAPAAASFSQQDGYNYGNPTV